MVVDDVRLIFDFNDDENQHPVHIEDQTLPTNPHHLQVHNLLRSSDPNKFE